MPPPPFLTPPPPVCLGFHLFLFVASPSCLQLLFPLLLRLIDALSFCQLWQWAKASIPNNHDGNGDSNYGNNHNSNSNGGGKGIRDFSSTSTPISLSQFDCCILYLGFGFVAPHSLPHHLPPRPSPHLPTPLLPTTSPPARHLQYHHHRLIVEYFIIFHFCRCCRVSPRVLLMGWALSRSSSPPLSSPSPISSFQTPLLHAASNQPTIIS